jgi:hypothetical protein
MVTRPGWYALLAAGCFTACSVDIRPLTVREPPPATIVIATFEDNDARPADPRFRPFQFYSYSPALDGLPPDAFVTSPIVRPGHDSNFALGLNWHLIDAPDGAASAPGVGVRTLVHGFIDLSAYSRLTFGEKYVATAGCQSVTQLKVTIFCDEHNTAFMAFTSLTPGWNNAVLNFSDFVESSYPGPNGTARSECFKVVDNIDFSVSMVLADGSCGAGELSLDDLSIRPPSGEAAGQSDGGIDGRGDADSAAPSVCQGTPPPSPLITDFSDAIDGAPIRFGMAPNITGQTFAYAAPGLAAPVLSVASAGVGGLGLKVAVDPGAATNPANTWLGFGVFFDSCIDASAFNAVKFTVAGDLGNCPIRFAATSSQTVVPANHPLGSCTLANCFPPSIPLKSTGTTIVRFSDFPSGNAGSPDLVDPSALIGVEWQMDTSVDFACHANFVVDDLSFVSMP